MRAFEELDLDGHERRKAAAGSSPDDGEGEVEARRWDANIAAAQAPRRSAHQSLLRPMMTQTDNDSSQHRFKVNQSVAFRTTAGSRLTATDGQSVCRPDEGRRARRQALPCKTPMMINTDNDETTTDASTIRQKGHVRSTNR